MKKMNQQTISMMVAKKTGFSKDLVEFVIKDFYAQILKVLRERSYNIIRIKNFLKFSDYGKRQ